MGGSSLESSLAGIGVSDRQGAIGHQIARPIDTRIFGDRACRARRRDDSRVIRTVDGDRDGGWGAISSPTVKVSVSVSPLPSA